MTSLLDFCYFFCRLLERQKTEIMQPKVESSTLQPDPRLIAPHPLFLPPSASTSVQTLSSLNVAAAGKPEPAPPAPPTYSAFRQQPPPMKVSYTCEQFVFLRTNRGYCFRFIYSSIRLPTLLSIYMYYRSHKQFVIF